MRKSSKFSTKLILTFLYAISCNFATFKFQSTIINNLCTLKWKWFDSSNIVSTTETKVKRRVERTRKVIATTWLVYHDNIPKLHRCARPVVSGPRQFGNAAQNPQYSWLNSKRLLSVPEDQDRLETWPSRREEFLFSRVTLETNPF